MTETGFNPTFVQEGQEFSDLNKAHDTDVADDGNREEGVYPVQNVHVDKAQIYGQGVVNAETQEELGEASQVLDVKDPETVVSEFDERTGQNPEANAVLTKMIEQKGQKIEAWEERKERVLGYVGNSKSIAELNENLNAARSAVTVGTLGEPQLKEILEVGKTKKVGLWEERKERVLGDIRDSRSITELNGNLNAARSAVTVGTLGEPQLKEILEVGENKSNSLQVVAAV